MRSTIFGGSVAAEIVWNGSSWSWNRGYVYSGSGLLAVQSGAAVSWVHEDPVTKSKRITNSSSSIISSIELDPWGADAGAVWSSNAAFQPRKFTTYDRDGNGSDEAMFRRHNRWHSRFDQPDPYDGSYDLTNPQSFNRYAYVQNDPVNFVDPSGLDPQDPLTPPTTPAIDPATGQPHPGGVPGPVASVDVNIGRGERSGAPGGTSSGEIEIETPTAPTEGEIIPQKLEGQPLSDCVKNLLAKYFDRGLLDSIRIHTDGLPSFVPSGMTAYTSNNNVYYARGAYDPHTAAGIAVLGHEATHSEQYRQNGNLRFKAKYLFSSLVAGIGVTVGRRGSVMPRFDSKRAYYGNKYEMDAERKEQQILNDLNQEYGGNNPCP